MYLKICVQDKLLYLAFSLGHILEATEEKTRGGFHY